MINIKTLSIFILTCITPSLSIAATQVVHEPLNLTNSFIGFASIAIFVIAYLMVMSEEFIDLRKSKPVIIAAGIIWGMIGWYYTQHGMPELAEHALRDNFLEYTELMLFLLVAMTYVNAMEERQVFNALRSWLINRGFGFRSLFWLTGMLAFFISPV
ncbi:MAG: sodium:proton antiporter NhaD, partial [Gammaproteobacteria bacterium]|nr:sodium:proton antiporter NhaD [Gammaproteobacteria bacterium]